jgi:hypothetical protein
MLCFTLGAGAAAAPATGVALIAIAAIAVPIDTIRFRGTIAHYRLPRSRSAILLAVVPRTYS